MTLFDARKSNPLGGGPSYSFWNRAVRALWLVTWTVLAAWTPAPLHRWRIFLLRLFGARVDWSAHVYGSALIWFPGNLSMDAHSCLGPRCNCYCMAPVALGRGAVVSQGAFLCSASHDIDDPYFQLIVKPITVGDGAWIAAEAFVGPGVTVGARAVVGAKAVLCRDAEPSGVYVGNPAKLTRYRGAGKRT